MESRVILTQLCTVFTISTFVLVGPADTFGPKVKRSDDTTLNSVQTLVQQQAAVIQRLESQLTLALNRLTTVESLSHQQSQEISTLKNRLDSTTRQVAFTVYFSADPAPDFGVHGILRFDHIVTNTANGYDAKTAIFTSPVSGLYVFHLDVMSKNNGPSVSINIVKDGVALDDAYASGVERNDQGNSLVTMHLKAECATCRNDWVSFGDSCYAFVDEKVTWSTAMEICRTIRGNLLEITSASENDFITSQMKLRKYANVWLRIQDFLREGTYVSLVSLQPVTYFNWDNGQLDNSHGSESGEDRLMVHRDGKWDDYWCDHSYTCDVVCEYL